MGISALLAACLPSNEGPEGLIGSEQVAIGADARMVVLQDRRVAVADGFGSLLLVEVGIARRGSDQRSIPLGSGAGGTEARSGPQVATTKAGHLVAVTDGGQLVHLVSPVMQQVTARLRVRAQPGLHAPITALALDGGGELLATGHADGALSVWDVATGKLTASAEPTDALQGPVRAIWLGPGTRAHVVGGRGEVVRWFPGQAPPERVLGPATGEVSDAALRGDTLLRAIGSSVEVWSCQQGALVSTFTPEASTPPLQVGVSWTGEWLAVAGHAQPGAKAAVEVWRRDGRSAECTFDGHRQGVISVAFGSSGRRVFSLGLDGRVRTWDLGY